MRVKIIFHGSLKKFCDKEFYEAEASTPAEAIRGITNQIKNFFRKDGKRFLCIAKECPTKDKLFSNLVDEELNIFPAYMCAGGGNKGSLITIAVGAILFAAAVAFFPAAAFATMGAFAAAVNGSLAATIGVSMMISGVLGLLSNLLTPTPKTSKSESDPESSRYFGTNQNTTTIGTPVAIGYGRYRVYGQLLSFNTQAVDR